MKRTNQKSLTAIYILAAATVVCVAVMVAVLCIPNEPIYGEFVPPAFDSAAVFGTPVVPQGLGYSSPYQDGMAYRFSICGNIITDDNNATVYLTNDANNEVYIKLRILDDRGEILGETGLIKPGEYVKNVELSRVVETGTEIKLKIMGYEPETYNSTGSVVLNTKVGEAS